MKHRIPKGSNCFTSIYTPCNDGASVYKIEHCPFWSLRSNNGIKVNCDYINATDSDKGLLLDQMKVCGINE